MSSWGSQGLIYFLRDVAGVGPIKIGFTTNLEKRLQMYRGHSPVVLEVLATISADRTHEGQLHRMFVRDRLHGEWFAESPELLAVIESFAVADGEDPVHVPFDHYRNASEGEASLIRRAMVETGKPQSWRDRQSWRQ